MRFVFDTEITQNFDAATRHEWLETNGLGGWAGSTIIGTNTRRYHGLLIAATQPPVGRVVLLSRLDEAIESNGARYELSSNQYPGVVHPTGFKHQTLFEKELFPAFEYSLDAIRLRKTVAAVHGENTTLIIYEVLASRGAFVLELRPFVAARDFHSLAQANESIRQGAEFNNGIFKVRAYDSVPDLCIKIPGASFEPAPDWYRNFEYAVEQDRGLDFQEDLFTHGVFRVSLESGDRLGVVVSIEDPRECDAFKLFEKERSRRLELLETVPGKDDLIQTLALAADQFVVQRDKVFKTIIAGYHWFTDWGRDTMIALPGLTLATGRFDDAKHIIRVFARNISQGMLPNRFPDAGLEPEYNTVDATLWFFIAIFKYLKVTGDTEFVQNELLPVLEEIVAWHERGTRHNIHVDDDGLLYAGEPGVQLTWMDAKIGGWVVTPRTGKAVEINALWYNALAILQFLFTSVGQETAARRFAQRAEKTRDRFQEEFWYEEGGYLYDYVNGDMRDASIRPNQIFALSLPFPLLEGQKAKKVLQTVTEKLWTPYGLRSLTPDDPHYRPVYSGNGFERDSAYHQGTVWAWLLGPWLTALVRVSGQEGKAQAWTHLREIIPHLENAGIGTVSEIFDAERPHTSRGCIAQAWSVAEILRAAVEDVLDGAQ